MKPFFVFVTNDGDIGAIDALAFNSLPQETKEPIVQIACVSAWNVYGALLNAPMEIFQHSQAYWRLTQRGY